MAVLPAPGAFDSNRCLDGPVCPDGPVDFFFYRADQGFHRHVPLVAPAVTAHGHVAGLQLASPGNRHEGDLHRLRLADLVPDFLVSHVRLDPESGVFEPARHAVDVLGLVFRYADHDRLYRRQPGRERAGAVLDIHAEEPFQAAEHGPVDQHRAGGLSGFGDVFQVEEFRHVEIKLARTQLPGTLQGVLDEEIHFRSVEGRFTRRYFVSDSQAVQHLGQGLLRVVPDLIGTGALGRAGGQVDADIVEAQHGVGV